MSKETQTASGSGISAAGLMGVAFVVLKLCHVIDWRWRWVLSPFWIPLAVWLTVMLLIAIGAGIAAMGSKP